MVVYINWAISTSLLVLMFICGFMAGVLYLSAILGWTAPRPRCSAALDPRNIVNIRDIGVAAYRKRPIRCIHREHEPHVAHVGTYRRGFLGVKCWINWGGTGT